MTNAMRLQQLPLMVSNHHSPDPESRASTRVGEVAACRSRQFATVAASSHTKSHTIFHPLSPSQRSVVRGWHRFLTEYALGTGDVS